MANPPEGVIENDMLGHGTKEILEEQEKFVSSMHKQKWGCVIKHIPIQAILLYTRLLERFIKIRHCGIQNGVAFGKEGFFIDRNLDSRDNACAFDNDVTLCVDIATSRVLKLESFRHGVSGLTTTKATRRILPDNRGAVFQGHIAAEKFAGA